MKTTISKLSAESVVESAQQKSNDIDVDPETGEIVTVENQSSLKSIVGGNALQKALAAAGFEIASYVTLPILKLGSSMTLIKIEKPPFLGKEVAQSSYGPPTLLEVTELMGGQRCHLIMGKVMKNELEARYPDEGYVGRYFAMAEQKVVKDDGKKYSLYAITEIAPISK